MRKNVETESGNNQRRNTRSLNIIILSWESKQFVSVLILHTQYKKSKFSTANKTAQIVGKEPCPDSKLRVRRWFHD